MTVNSAQIACTAGAATSALASTITKGSAAVTWNRGQKSFAYDWLSPSGKAAYGTCWRLTAATADGATRSATVELTK
jgi:hypothetical protein